MTTRERPWTWKTLSPTIFPPNLGGFFSSSTNSANVSPRRPTLLCLFPRDYPNERFPLPTRSQVPPTNQTKLEGEKVQFTCEAKAMPGNVTVRWYREGTLVHEVQALDSRVTVRKDNALVINPVSADDSGQYLCEVSNGIGDPQSASAYLNVECE